MKKLSLFFLLILCSGGLFMATEPVASQTPFTLVLKVGAQTSPALAHLIADYNANQTNGQYMVKIDERSFETDTQLDGYNNLLKAQDNSFDVFATDVIWTANLSKYLVDLSDVFPTSEQSKFLPAAIKADTWNNSILAVPWFHDSGLLYYRTDVLQYAKDQGLISSANPPSTLAELKQYAELASNQAITNQFGAMDGFVWQGTTYEGLTCDFVEYMGAFGQQSLLNVFANGTITANISTTAVTESLKYMRSLVADGASPLSVTTFNEESSRSVWDSGNAIFMRNWPYAYKLSLISNNLNGTNNGSGQQQFAVAPIPSADGNPNANTSALGGWGLAVSKYSNHIAEAKDLVLWLTQEQQQIRHFAENGNLPTRMSAYDTTKLTAAGAGDQTYIVDFLPAFQNAIPRPSYPAYPEISSLLWSPINSAVKGQITVDEAVNQMDVAVTNYLHPESMNTTSSDTSSSSSSSSSSSESVSSSSSSLPSDTSSSPSLVSLPFSISWFMVAIIPLVIINRRRKY